MEGTIGEIRMFAGTFAPRTWAFCANQTLNINTNTALFSILGTTYGGNGQTTFALPDFRGRVAVGTGTGAGLPNVVLGQMAGTPTMTLLAPNMPAHVHQVIGTVVQQVNNDSANLTDDANGARLGASGSIFTTATTDLVNMAPIQINATSTIAGGNQAFSIMPPYLGMNYIICLQGLFPSRD